MTNNPIPANLISQRDRQTVKQTYRQPDIVQFQIKFRASYRPTSCIVLHWSIVRTDPLEFTCYEIQGFVFAGWRHIQKLVGSDTEMRGPFDTGCKVHV